MSENVMKDVTRRQVMQGVSGAALAAMMPQFAFAQSADPFVGPFGADSTAADVVADIDLTGKTAMITGANSGLGYETMRVLAARGAHVIGVARTEEKAKTACDSIDGKTTPLVCELSNLESVANCAEQTKGLGIPIDMLICNAGIMALPELQQVNGIERHFFINHVGHFLLINNVLESVKAAAQGRVVILSSLGYKWAPEEGIQFDNLSGEQGEYDANMFYGQSKLANALTAYELSKRLEGTTTTANSVHPGIINTNLGRHFPWYTRLFASLLGWTFMKSVEEGAATQAYVATHPNLATVSGHYFEDCNPVVPEGSHMNNPELSAKLWQVSEDLVGDYLQSPFA